MNSGFREHCGRRGWKTARARGPRNLMCNCVSILIGILMIPQQYSCLNNIWLRTAPGEMLMERKQILQDSKPRQTAISNQGMLTSERRELSSPGINILVGYSMPSGHPWNHTHTSNTNYIDCASAFIYWGRVLCGKCWRRKGKKENKVITF